MFYQSHDVRQKKIGINNDICLTVTIRSYKNKYLSFKKIFLTQNKIIIKLLWKWTAVAIEMTG